MRNRIKEHRRVRAGDIVPHELNPRLHSSAQEHALRALIAEIGFARSLLAYELPDGRLKLIDGHLRRDVLPDEVVDVEVLDVNDAEARALLLVIDPLAQLAGYDSPLLADLRERTEKESAAVASLWEVLEEASRGTRRNLDAAQQLPEERYYVLVECRDETQQRELLERFHREGLVCQAKIG